MSLLTETLTNAAAELFGTGAYFSLYGEATSKETTYPKWWQFWRAPETRSHTHEVETSRVWLDIANVDSLEGRIDLSEVPQSWSIWFYGYIHGYRYHSKDGTLLCWAKFSHPHVVVPGDDFRVATPSIGFWVG
jgi:hypothetical protein